jgi:hypothetical protein
VFLVHSPENISLAKFGYMQYLASADDQGCKNTKWWVSDLPTGLKAPDFLSGPEVQKIDKPIIATNHNLQQTEKANIYLHK